MKRLIVVLISLLIAYVIYFDLTKGTLPANTVMGENEEKVQKHSSNQSHPYFEYKVQSGDTVLSIVEKKLEHGLPVSISKVVSDFKELNDIRPEEIQINKVYKFPAYQDKNKKQD